MSSSIELFKCCSSRGRGSPDGAPTPPYLWTILSRCDARLLVARGEQPIALRPRSLAVLQYLVEHPGRLVTKAELRRQVWAGTHVTDIVLRVSIREIRAALGDSATTPHYVETVGQEGYRFLVG
jgi:DNA-binding winged helix-turn-helix (wHTH) protein